MAAICSRCNESLVDSIRGCEFCRGERREKAVRVLVAATKSSSNVALSARAQSISTLRSLGHSKAEVLHARARAVDGHSVEEILDGLLGGVGVEVAG